jgi:hypothetical protein
MASSSAGIGAAGSAEVTMNMKRTTLAGLPKSTNDCLSQRPSDYRRELPIIYLRRIMDMVVRQCQTDVDAITSPRLSL